MRLLVVCGCEVLCGSPGCARPPASPFLTASLNSHTPTQQPHPHSTATPSTPSLPAAWRAPRSAGGSAPTRSWRMLPSCRRRRRRSSRWWRRERAQARLAWPAGPSCVCSACASFCVSSFSPFLVLNYFIFLQPSPTPATANTNDVWRSNPAPLTTAGSNEQVRAIKGIAAAHIRLPQGLFLFADAWQGLSASAPVGVMGWQGQEVGTGPGALETVKVRAGASGSGARSALEARKG